MGTFEGVHAELLVVPIEWKDGCIVPSTRPGRGHEPNETVAHRLAVGGHDRPWGSIDSTAPRKASGRT